MDSKTVEQIVNYSNMMVPFNYPIENEWLRREPGIRNTYFKVLTAVIQQRDSVSQNQAGIFTRLLVGALGRSADNFDLDSYLSLNTDMEPNEYSRFIAAIKDKPVKYRLVTDMTVIACSDTDNSRQLALISVVMDALMITEKECELLCRISRSIITQDSGLFWELEENAGNGGSVDMSLFSPYFSYYLEDMNIENPDEFTVKLGTKKDFTLHSILPGTPVENKKVKIKNAVINLSAGSLIFSGNESVELINCDFLSGMNPISFLGVKEVLISGCRFSGFRNRAIFEDMVGVIRIINCEFTDCHYYYDSKSNYELGGVIYTPDNSKNAANVIENCSFSECGCVNSRVYEASAVISNCSCVVRDSEFKICWAYCAADRPRKEKRSTSPNSYLFLLGTVDNNNKLRDSLGFSNTLK